MTSVLLVFFLLTSSLSAQSLPPAPSETSTTEPQVTEQTPSPPILSRDQFFSKGFVRQLLKDQRSIWTSPARIKTSDAKWFVPLAGATTLLFTEDNQISHRFDHVPSLQKTSLKIWVCVWTSGAALSRTSITTFHVAGSDGRSYVHVRRMTGAIEAGSS